ncbi:MAG: phage tail tape measure protein [Ktedonobacteraceae bacterium]
MKLAEGGQANAQDVTAGLTAIMHDYNAGADQATHYTDLMSEAILRGKQSAQDFTSNIGPLAAAGQNVGLSFEQVAAAEATMTQISPKVALDTQQLRQLFQFLSPTMGGVAKAAKGLKLNFDEAHYSSLDLLGKLQYLSEIAGGTSTAAFVKLTGGIRGSTAAIDLLKGGGKTFQDNLNAMGHAAGATAHAFDTWENTIPAHLDKIGAALSVFATKTMDALGPKLIPIIDKITSAIGVMSDLIINHTNDVRYLIMRGVRIVALVACG